MPTRKRVNPGGARLSALLLGHTALDFDRSSGLSATASFLFEKRCLQIEVTARGQAREDERFVFEIAADSVTAVDFQVLGIKAHSKGRSGHPEARLQVELSEPPIGRDNVSGNVLRLRSPSISPPPFGFGLGLNQEEEGEEEKEKEKEEKEDDEEAEQQSPSGAKAKALQRARAPLTPKSPFASALQQLELERRALNEVRGGSSTAPASSSSWGARAKHETLKAEGASGVADGILFVQLHTPLREVGGLASIAELLLRRGGGGGGGGESTYWRQEGEREGGEGEAHHPFLPPPSPGIPSFARFVPDSLYSPRVRGAIELLLFLVTVFQIAWAM